MRDPTVRRLEQIERRHDPDHDVPDGPDVTWAERALLEAVRELEREIEELRGELASLRRRRW